MMLVPGWVSMRNVSHLPPANTISELAKRGAALGDLGAVHHDGGAAAHARFLFDDELNCFGGRMLSASRAERMTGNAR